jgi:Raf kinase inhibitor-like YbhB/YbcL family protein
MAITITSLVFKEGETIPRQYTCDGNDQSPPLAWSGVPEGTRSLALIMDDPDAPGRTFVHWVLYDLAADVTELPESVKESGIQGRNDFRVSGYRGPCPPKGPAHRYFFKLYALDSRLNLPAGAAKADLEKAMQGHILSQGQLIGKYGR